MYIQGTSHVHGPQSISAPHRTQASPATPSTQSSSRVDQLDISPEASFVSQTRDIPDVRTELVSRIRAEIASGSYETEARLDGALNALLEEIG